MIFRTKQAISNEIGFVRFDKIQLYLLICNRFKQRIKSFLRGCYNLNGLTKFLNLIKEFCCLLFNKPNIIFQQVSSQQYYVITAKFCLRNDISVQITIFSHSCKINWAQCELSILVFQYCCTNLTLYPPGWCV